MADHVVYVDRFTIRDGKLEDFERYAADMATFVEEREPGVLSFDYFVNGEGTGGTAVFVFADADALDTHLDVAGSRLQEGAQLLSATEIELLGAASERAVQLAKSFDASFAGRLAGFSR